MKTNVNPAHHYRRCKIDHTAAPADDYTSDISADAEYQECDKEYCRKDSENRIILYHRLQQPQRPLIEKVEKDHIVATAEIIEEEKFGADNCRQYCIHDGKVPPHYVLQTLISPRAFKERDYKNSQNHRQRNICDCLCVETPGVPQK